LVVNKSLKNYIKIFIKFLAILLSNVKNSRKLMSCTHIPNIIDLSGKTKKIWSGQASLRRSGSRRSGRKNQL
jgi:hypothetical protein